VTHDQQAGQHPAIKITKGNPTDEEIAAVVAVLTALAASGPVPSPEEPRSGWAAYWRAVAAPVTPGPGAWQAAVRRIHR
jgi:hypothetical protein